MHRRLQPARLLELRRRARGASGQAVVEFALVVPLIAALVLILVDFGKSMNYWLDLQQVANEAARQAAVNGTVSDASIRARLKSKELEDGGADSSADAACIAVSLTGTDVGDAVTVEISSTYHWFSFPDWIPIGDRDSWTIKGSATMRLERVPTYGAIGPCP